ncbi:hypothetical protein K8R42_00270, partial [bacterium]|nr:hypothetical protein [bacterium]
MRRVFFFALLVSVFTATSLATTIHVPGDQPTVQAGLNIATADDTVLVANGTYLENIIWPAVNGIKLIGGGEEDCFLNGDSLASVIRFEAVGQIIDTTTLISGFTIQNGYAHGDYPYCYGGGIYCNSACPSLASVTIIGNTASSGGAVFCCYLSHPALTNVTITNNSASANGGGIRCYESSPSMVNVIIAENSACRGGGINCTSHSGPNLTNVTINNNTASIEGGGIYCYSFANPSLLNVTISDNTASIDGGGVSCKSFANPNLSDVAITGNSAGWHGGGVYCD